MHRPLPFRIVTLRAEERDEGVDLTGPEDVCVVVFPTAEHSAKTADIKVFRQRKGTRRAPNAI